MKTHRVIELLRELRSHALWDAIRTVWEHSKEIFRWETVTGTFRYLGSIGGTLLAGAQWMGHNHGFLFIVGILLAGISLLRIGIVYGRQPPTQQIEEQQPQQTDAPSIGEQQPKTYRVTEEATQSVTTGDTTVTVTVRRIVEVSVAMLICVAVGSRFFSPDRAELARLRPETQPIATPAPDSLWKGDKHEDRLFSRRRQSGKNRTVHARNDPDYPVWVPPNSDTYVCYGSDWEEYWKHSQGTWMKQSQAIAEHKKPFYASCE